MANLNGQNVGTNYKGILNLDATTINTPLDATLRAVTDGMGTSSLLQLSTAAVTMGSGTITSNGLLTIKGSGANILSLRDSSNVERGYVSNTGIFGVGQKIQFMPNGDFIEGSHNSGYTQIVSGQNCQIVPNGFPFRFLSTGILCLGGTSSSFPAIKRNGAAIDFRLADDSANCNIGANNITALAGIAAYSTIEGYSSSQAGSFTGAVRVGLGGSNSASAILDVVSTTKGFLPPRLTTTQKNAISTPATGLVVYDSTLNKLAVYTGAAWETVTSA